MNKNYKWHDRLSVSYFCDLNGKILGSINGIDGNIYMARYNNVVLGKYISSETAKGAIEHEHDTIGAVVWTKKIDG